MNWFTSSLCSMAIMTAAQSSGVFAETPPTTPTTNHFSCSKEELMTFFPAQVVSNVLIKANFSQEDANTIAQELSQKNPELIKIVEEKASKLDPNPFKDLSQRDIGLKIYRETLYEVFSKVLKAHGVSDEDKIQNLLDEMREAKSRLFIECIRKQQNPAATEPPAS